MANRGRNAGVTGLVDLTGTTAFTVQVTRYKDSVACPRWRRTGYSSTAGWEENRALDETATLSIVGKVQAQGYPRPTSLKNATGTIVLSFEAGKTVTYAVSCQDSSLSYDEKNESFWDVSLVFSINSKPTFAGWPGTQNNPSAPGASDALTYEGMTKVLDPQGISSQATLRIDSLGLATTQAAEVTKLTALLATATPLTGLKARSGNLVRTNSDGAITTITYGPNDTKDDIELPGRTSGRTIEGVSTREYAEVVTCVDADTDAGLANTYWVLYQNNAYVVGVSARKITPTRAVITTTYRDIGFQLSGSTNGQPRWVPARINGSTKEIYVAEKAPFASSNTFVRLSLQQIMGGVRSFTLHRIGTSTSGAIPDFASLVGQTNSASFLNLSAGTCMYLGAEYRTQYLASPSTRQFDMYFHFYSDPIGFFELDGWREEFFTAATVSALGWQDVATFSSDGLTMTATTQGDFSVFLGAFP